MKDHIDTVLQLVLLALPTLYIQTDTSRWKTQELLHCLVYHPSIFLFACQGLAIRGNTNEDSNSVNKFMSANCPSAEVIVGSQGITE